MSHFSVSQFHSHSFNWIEFLSLNVWWFGIWWINRNKPVWYTLSPLRIWYIKFKNRSSISTPTTNKNNNNGTEYKKTRFICSADSSMYGSIKHAHYTNKQQLKFYTKDNEERINCNSNATNFLFIYLFARVCCCCCGFFSSIVSYNLSCDALLEILYFCEISVQFMRINGMSGNLFSKINHCKRFRFYWNLKLKIIYSVDCGYQHHNKSSYWYDWLFVMTLNVTHNTTYNNKKHTFLYSI